jgi:hypothetical protein
MREQTNRHHGPERTMNHINAEMNVIEVEVVESQTLSAVEDAITELSSTQLMMVGGGGSVVFI